MIGKEQIPSIDWDGETPLVTVEPWIAEDVSIFSSLDHMTREIGKRGEVTPPSNNPLEWLVFYFTSRRINKFRKG